jgi:hypothetical protein
LTNTTNNVKSRGAAETIYIMENIKTTEPIQLTSMIFIDPEQKTGIREISSATTIAANQICTSKAVNGTFCESNLKQKRNIYKQFIDGEFSKACKPFGLPHIEGDSVTSISHNEVLSGISHYPATKLNADTIPCEPPSFDASITEPPQSAFDLESDRFESKPPAALSRLEEYLLGEFWQQD